MMIKNRYNAKYNARWDNVPTYDEIASFQILLCFIVMHVQ